MENTPFKPGDAVVLSGGPYFGNPGTFIRLLDEDNNWAAIKGRTGLVRKHPLVWLDHAPVKKL
jgi:hypothetical protein